MPVLDRMRIGWSGFPGGPGVSTMYFTDAAAALAPVRAFFLQCATYIPAAVTISVENTGDVIDTVTGKITNTWAGANQIPFNSGNAGSYAAPVGAQIRWNTNSIINGRRVRGRTDLVPLLSTAFDNDGTLTGTAFTTFHDAATGLVSTLGATFSIYQRPFVGTPSWTDVHGKLHPARAARVGGFVPVTSGTPIDKAVVLRSRRD